MLFVKIINERGISRNNFQKAFLISVIHRSLPSEANKSRAKSFHAKRATLRQSATTKQKKEALWRTAAPYKASAIFFY